jgi:hypothetical protein
MSNIEIKVIPMDPPPSSTTAPSTPPGHIQRVRITFQGIVQLCTDAELENARLKRHCLNRRRGPLPSHDMNIPPDSTIATEIPFREKYLVMDVMASCPHSHDTTAIPWNEVTTTNVLRNDGRCRHAVMHVYHSRGEYQRKCHSASKKQRLRVDRVSDGEECMRFLLQYCTSDVRLGVWNADTDFCVNSADGNKVLSTWYVRALSRDDKRRWMDALRIVTERKAQDSGSESLR